MTFVLVTLAIMAAGIYLIYKLTKLFGFKLEYKSLVLCAVMAFAVNITAVMMSPYLTQGHYWRLVGLILIASALVTVYNERLLRAEATSIHEPLKVTDDVPGIADKLKVSATEREAVEKAVNVPERKVADAVAANESSVKEKSGEKSKKAHDTDARETKPETKKNIKDAKKFAKGKNTLSPSSSGSANIPLNRLNTLDLLLDYAYEQKKLGEPDKAIAAYRAALQNYSDDDYVPFIVIDLGNTYKEIAAYDDAIGTYRDALKIPVIAADESTCQEFANNLAYLKTLKRVLERHKALDTPFPLIPAPYMAEIERKFQAGWGKLS